MYVKEPCVSCHSFYLVAMVTVKISLQLRLADNLIHLALHTKADF